MSNKICLADAFVFVFICFEEAMVHKVIGNGKSHATRSNFWPEGANLMFS
jgi:hypothetical protein